MARKRIEVTQLQSWEEVDEALRNIGVIDRELALIEAGQNESIDKVKKESLDKAAPFMARKEGLETAIKEYCDANRAEFIKVKTKCMSFGEVGYRLSTKIMIKRVADTLQALKDLAFKNCIRTKEELDKEAMKSLTDEQLAQVGATRKTENVFGYTINQERLQGV